MAAPKLKYAIGNSASTTLAGSITASDTSASLTSDTNFNAKGGEGLVIIDEGQDTEEIAYATGKAGSALTVPVANRGLESTSAAAHTGGAAVKGTFSAGMWNDLVDTLLNIVDQTTGAVDTTKVLTLTGTQTTTNKTLGSGTKVGIGSDGTGDIYYRASGGALTRLPIGAATQILKVNAGATAPEWASGSGQATLVAMNATAGSLTTTSGSDQDITNASTAITLTAGNNWDVFVTISGGFYCDDATKGTVITLKRGSTTLQSFTYDTTEASKRQSFSFTYLDSDQAAATNTYKGTLATSSGSPNVTADGVRITVMAVQRSS